ncbi:MAG: hypothetical protein KIS73_30465 [Enhydrobacter sp.]|nr:hypothetical protein [Enhydrobacter sp.]
MTRRRLLLTTALVPIGLLPAPYSAAALGLVPERDAAGRVTALVNPEAVAALRRALQSGRNS